MGRYQREGKHRGVHFEDIFNVERYVSILEDFLLPFLRNVHPDGNSFIQDNDRKHTSKMALAFFWEENGLNW